MVFSLHMQKIVAQQLVLTHVPEAQQLVLTHVLEGPSVFCLFYEAI